MSLHHVYVVTGIEEHAGDKVPSFVQAVFQLRRDADTFANELKMQEWQHVIIRWEHVK